MKILEWIESYRSQIKHNIKKIPFSECQQWHLIGGYITRKDGAFFSVGSVLSDHSTAHPIINQHEIGILGFISRQHQGKTQILLHAKSEPGNMNLTQIGPSVQATASNFKIKHHGNRTYFLDQIIGKKGNLIYAYNQSEQGNRFYNKYNCNVLVKATDDIENVEDLRFMWADISDIIPLLNKSYLFNTDFKSVISHMLPRFLAMTRNDGNALAVSIYNSFHFGNKDSNELIIEINKKRFDKRQNSKFSTLDQLTGYQTEDHSLTMLDNYDFGFDYYDILLEDREVLHWQQPLIIKKSIEKLILCTAIIDGQLHVVLRERYEAGYLNTFQLGPTHQFDDHNQPKIESSAQVLAQFKQSEEGGRFYKNLSLYSIVILNDLENYKDSEGFYILDLREICSLLEIEGMLTNEMRTMLSALIPLLDIDITTVEFELPDKKSSSLEINKLSKPETV